MVQFYARDTPITGEVSSGQLMRTLMGRLCLPGCHLLSDDGHEGEETGVVVRERFGSEVGSGPASGATGYPETVGSIGRVPEEVLRSILALVNESSGNYALCCMEVCKQWNVILPLEVSTLTLTPWASPLPTIEKMAPFKNLRCLTIDRSRSFGCGWALVFEALGATFKELTVLHLIDLKPPLTTADVQALFSHCPKLREIRFQASLAPTPHGPLPLDSAPPSLSSLQISGLLDPLTLSPLAHLRSLQALTINLYLFHTPPPLSPLTSLRHIDFSRCKALRSPLSFVSLPLLASLNLSECTNIAEGPQMQNLPSLQTLAMWRCKRLETLPDVEHLTGLRHLDLRACPRLRPAPSLSKLLRLQSLSLDFNQDEDHNSNSATTNSIIDLSIFSALEHLSLQDEKGTAGLPPLTFPPGIRDLTFLTGTRTRIVFTLGNSNFLEQQASYALQSLPSFEPLRSLDSLTLSVGRAPIDIGPVSNLTSLRQLSITDCDKLVSLPSLDLLGALRELTVKNCPQITELHTVATLFKLSIEGCLALSNFPEGEAKAALPCLRSLHLRDCRSMRQLPPLHSSTDLLSLRVVHCWRLKSLPPLDSLQKLEELRLYDCRMLGSLPRLSLLTSLRTLALGALSDSLREIPELSGLRCLEKLSVNFGAVTSLPPLDDLRSLRVLSFWGLSDLKEMPLLAGLVSLRELDLQGCKSLRAIPSLDGVLKLQRLDLSFCESLEALPRLVQLTRLMNVNLYGCVELKQMPPREDLCEAVMIDGPDG